MPGLNGRTKIYAGNANRALAEHIASALGMQLSPVELTQFSDGEIRCEIPEHVRGNHTFIIQPTCAPTNDHVMELMVLADALRRQNVKDITAVIPYYGYARQDRKPGFSRTPVTSRLIANMIEMVGIDQVILVDIHSEQQLGFFNIPVINISAAPIIVADIWRDHYSLSMSDTVIVSPDTGGVARARMIAKQLDNAQLAIVDKRRPEANVAEVMNIIGDVEGKRCIIVDDMIDTAGTLCKAAVALKERGAEYVAAYATHPVFSGNAYNNIATSVLDEVVVTDTIPIEAGTRKIRQISVASIIAETMRRVRSKQSVSQIYTGS